MTAVGCSRAISGLAIAAGLSLVAGVAIRAQSGTPASTGQPTPTFTKHVLPITTIRTGSPRSGKADRVRHRQRKD